jgi:NAD(P) transhydrogenase
MSTLTDIFGGFLITKRMLDLFRRPTDPKDYAWLYFIPFALFAVGMIWGSGMWDEVTNPNKARVEGKEARERRMGGLVQAGYFLSILLAIGALSGLSSQVRKRPFHT